MKYKYEFLYDSRQEFLWDEYQDYIAKKPMTLIAEGVTETTFDAIIDEMIANAWYSVREFHIHLSGVQTNGEVRDGLERAILLLTKRVVSHQLSPSLGLLDPLYKRRSYTSK